MDLHETNDHRGFWTNEKHASFIYSMEASFVQTMLQNDRCSRLTYTTTPRPRLNRYLPDISESTLDSKNRRDTKTTQLYFQDLLNPNTGNNVRTGGKTSSLSSQPHDASQDQESIRTTTALLNLPRNGFPSTGAKTARFKCSASQTGFFTRLGRLIKEKAKSDVEKIFSGFSKTRDNLAVIDELLMFWNLAETDRVLDELEEALLVSDFGPKITIKIVESLREDILSGKLKSGSEIKDALKKSVLNFLTSKGTKTELQLGFRKPAVIIIVGVNGGGKTTSLGKLAHRLKKEGVKILMAAGDTFRAAASDQLEVWAERTESEIVVAEGENVKASSVLSQAVKKGKEQGFDVVLCDTSGRLHTNYSLMEELIACKKAVGKVVPGAPNVVGITGLILTKLDGSARGGCVVSVVDELGIPIKFVGVGEGVEDLQPFDAEAFVNAIFS
ncbi:hypothetical protein HHK36_001099 [Tetracentron sinense]|uniref:SRP54-type proteins GTP-binding domain-containing protein n=2 Tax=Magnoliopsida TaxID=3398 RepID=A0A834ZXH8_TETSI|nr:hypothetical protein HHK36_001099 [Tetracentron sinense]